MKQPQASQHKDRKAVPPYLPYKTFRNFIDGLKGQIPGRIDRSLMGTMSGAAQTQLLKALEYMELISSNGIPSKRLDNLVETEGVSRGVALGGLLKEYYPFLFESGFNLENATYPQLVEQFQKSGATGDTVRKGVAFFVAAAKDTGIPLSQYILNKAKRGPSGLATSRTAWKRTQRGRRNDSASPPQSPAGGQMSDWQKSLLAMMPQFDPKWSQQERESYFEAIKEIKRIGDAEGETK